MAYAVLTERKGVELMNWQEELAGKTLYIWGASIGGTQALSALERENMRVEAYCDNNEKKQGQLYNGVPVISPAHLKTVLDESAVIIIASFAFETIYTQIRAKGIDCPVYIYLLYDPCHLKSGMILYSGEEKDAIRALYSDDAYTQKMLDLVLEKGFLNTDSFANVKDHIGFGGIDAYYYDAIASKVHRGGGTALLHRRGQLHRRLHPAGAERISGQH